MRNPSRTTQDAFKLADNVESYLQVADSFKLELSNNLPLVEVNEISAETSGDEFEVNDMSRGKKWGNNNSNYNTYKYKY